MRTFLAIILIAFQLIGIYAFNATIGRPRPPVDLTTAALGTLVSIVTIIIIVFLWVAPQ